MLASDPLDIELEERKAEREFCFVQWYEMIDESILAVDKIGAVLNCMRLRWQETPGEPNLLLGSKKYGLLSMESVRVVI